MPVGDFFNYPENQISRIYKNSHPFTKEKNLEFMKNIEHELEKMKLNPALSEIEPLPFDEIESEQS